MSNATGYSATEAVSRLVSSVGKVQKTTMALIVMAKMKGRTNKAIRTAFADKAPSWISGAFAYADKFMAAVLPNETQVEISAMTVAAAETELVRRIEAHMTALGVTSFEKYKSVCHFAERCEASDNVLNPPAEEAVPAPEAATEAEAEAVIELPPEVPAERDLLAECAAIVALLSKDELLAHAAHVQAAIVAMVEAERIAAETVAADQAGASVAAETSREEKLAKPGKRKVVKSLADLAIAA